MSDKDQFDAIIFNPAHPDAFMVVDAEDRHFIILASMMSVFRADVDEPPLAAANRAWARNPSLFVQVQPGQARSSIETEHGFSGDLTERDRNRLRAIIRKHHRAYFADHPTDAQCDNLIDGLGLRVAERIVRAAVDGGKIA